jgi:hypothetical protein
MGRTTGHSRGARTPARAGAVGQGARLPAGVRLVVLALIALAAALAVPRLGAGLVAMPYAPLPGSQEDARYQAWLGRAADAFATAAAWHDDARYWRQLAEARYRLAALEPGPRGQTTAMRAVLAAQRESLARRPVDPYGWTRLAAGLLRLEGNTRAFREAYRQAVATGPLVPSLLATRAALGLVADFDITSPLSQTADRQLARAARHAPERLARAVTSPALRGRALDRLADRPDLRCRSAAAFAGRALDRGPGGPCGS